MCGIRSNSIAAILGLIFCAVSSSVYAWSWDDLWLTPHQQASREMNNENFEALINHENSDWQGVGHYQLGDHAAAAERFAGGGSISSQYNHATALTQAGEYEKAIELFDEVLNQQPTHEKAQKNRDIARQLKELQQEQQQDSQEGESEQNNNEQETSEQNQDSASDSQDSQSSDDEQNGQSQAEKEQQNEGEQEQQEKSDEEPEDAAQQQANQEAEVPLSEDQQATEQWLRKIPDDPAGLLRRKLRRNHAAEYPNVVNSESPW